MMDCNAVAASRTRFFEMPAFCRSLVSFHSVVNDLPRVNQRCLLVPEIDLQAQPILAFNNGFDDCVFDSASVHVYADALPDVELSVGLFWFAGHAQILPHRRN